MTTTPDLPLPAGATTDGHWSDHMNSDGVDTVRALLWSRHDTDKVGVAVDGWQTASGEVTRSVSLYDTDKELTAADARRLAAALMDAADTLDALAD